MRRTVRLTERDLTRLVKRVINENNTSVEYRDRIYANSSELFDMDFKKIMRGLHQVQQTAESGNGEEAAFVIGNIILDLKSLKSLVDEMRAIADEIRETK
jgi:septation ring formation regulator EzrA